MSKPYEPEHDFDWMHMDKDDGTLNAGTHGCGCCAEYFSSDDTYDDGVPKRDWQANALTLMFQKMHGVDIYMKMWLKLTEDDRTPEDIQQVRKELKDHIDTCMCTLECLCPWSSKD